MVSLALSPSPLSSLSSSAAASSRVSSASAIVLLRMLVGDRRVFRCFASAGSLQARSLSLFYTLPILGLPLFHAKGSTKKKTLLQSSSDTLSTIFPRTASPSSASCALAASSSGSTWLTSTRSLPASISLETSARAAPSGVTSVGPS